MKTLGPGVPIPVRIVHWTLRVPPLPGTEAAACGFAPATMVNSPPAGSPSVTSGA